MNRQGIRAGQCVNSCERIGSYCGGQFPGRNQDGLLFVGLGKDGGLRTPVDEQGSESRLAWQSSLFGHKPEFSDKRPTKAGYEGVEEVT